MKFANWYNQLPIHFGGLVCTNLSEKTMILQFKSGWTFNEFCGSYSKDDFWQWSLPAIITHSEMCVIRLIHWGKNTGYGECM